MKRSTCTIAVEDTVESLHLVRLARIGLDANSMRGVLTSISKLWAIAVDQPVHPVHVIHRRPGGGVDDPADLAVLECGAFDV